MGAGIHGGFGYTKGYREAVAGNAIFASGEKEYFKNISKRNDIDPKGKYDIVAHGNKNSIQIEHNSKDIEIDSRVLARILKNRKDYKKKQTIRLLSCNTGNLDNGFAQNLANKLGVIVYAPPDIIWAQDNGNHFIAPYKKGTLSPDDKIRYKFRKFLPGGKR